MKLLTAIEASAKETELLADFYHAQPISRLITGDIANFGKEAAQALFEKVQKHIPMCTKLLKDAQYAATSTEKNSPFIVMEHDNEYAIVAWHDGSMQLFATERSGLNHLPTFYQAFCEFVKGV